MDLEHLKYPIGKFKKPKEIRPKHIKSWIEDLESLASSVSAICIELKERDLDRIYRPGGWTIRQVIHHIVDSHLNAYVRFKWALTESNPTIKAYDEVAWAEMPDAKKGPIDFSLLMLEGLHLRWVYAINKIPNEDFQKSYFHPEDKETVLMSEFIGKYAWHGKHHLAHINQALENEF